MKELIQYANNILFEEYTEGNPKILNFLKKRKFTFPDLDYYQIGYIRENNPIPKFINDNKEYYTEIKVLKNGRLTITDRIIIPIRNTDGDFCMISCRDAKEYSIEAVKLSDQKYMTMKDTNANKNEILDGFYENKQNILFNNKVIICEGNTDRLSHDIFGIKYSVAISGRNFSEFHLSMINSISKRIDIILATDNDSTGTEIMVEFIVKHPELINKLYYIEWDDIDIKDPDEYLNKYGTDKYLSLVKPVSYLFSGNGSIRKDYDSLLNQIDLACDSVFTNAHAETDRYVKGEINRTQVSRPQYILKTCYDFFEYKMNNKLQPPSFYNIGIINECETKLSEMISLLPKFQLRNKLYFIFLIYQNSKDLQKALLAIDSIRIIAPEYVRPYYFAVLKKFIKTFENAGEFCYYIVYHNIRIEWMAEYCIALWFTVSNRKGIGRYAKFNRNKLDKWFCVTDIKFINTYEKKIEAGEIQFRPQLNKYGDVLNVKIEGNHTEELLYCTATSYLKRCEMWENKNDGKNTR